MKRWWYKLLIRLRDSVGGETSEELVNKCSDGILTDILNSELTIRQQSETLFLTIKKLSDYRKTQIEETQKRLAILEEDMARLNK